MLTPAIPFGQLIVLYMCILNQERPVPKFEPLSREEVIKAVERRRPSRIPLVRAQWWGEGLHTQYGDRLKHFDQYPEDVVQGWINPLDTSKMGLSWKLKEEGGAFDNSAVIDDWAKLDEFIAKMPDPRNSPVFEPLIAQAEKARREGRYYMFCFWRLFFERPWELRGMQDLMADYYENPEQVHKLHSALCRLYLGYLETAVKLLKPDGFFTSDDLGHQSQPMIAPRTFVEFLKPYYMQMGAYLKQEHIHWWLHSCGNNTPLLPHLIDAGVNVFHPVQKGTMDEIAVAKQFGDKICFLAGIDVQHTLQETDAAGVRKEVRFLIDTFDRPEGGLCLAAGNGIVGGTPFENIDAFLSEALIYGAEHRAKLAQVPELAGAGK